MDLNLMAELGFILVSLVCIIILYAGIIRASRKMDKAKRKKVKSRFLIGIFLWISFLAIVSISGFIGDFNKIPPPFIIVIIPPLIVLVILMRSSIMKELLANISQKSIVYLQTFRIAVEILLWFLFLDEIIPIQMTFEGRNFDILAGMSAPLMVIFCISGNKMKRSALMIWNILGLLLLGNIVAIAIMSTPSILRVFMNDPANTIVTQWPVVLLPGILVPLAYYLHFFSISKLKAANTK